MREYIYSLMTDKKRGLFASIIKIILFIISWFYRVGFGFVKFVNGLRARKPKCKVISIGNISLGGTGKTPTACMLAKRLKGQNKKVAVLIRGYGNDEWKMIKEMLDPIPVLVGPDRVKNSEYAISRFGVDTVILDDGFQHWRIKRDLDIVLIDSSNPFGNGSLFPRGVLRENPAALKRADIILLTKTDLGKDNIDKIKKTLREITPEVPIAKSSYKPKYLYKLSNKERLDLSPIRGKSIASLSSIVNPEYFEFVLKNLGADIKLSFHYPDHYHYREKDIEDIIYRCNEAGIDTIVTTEKDAVKLQDLSLRASVASEAISEIASAPAAPRNDGTILVLHIEPEITEGEEVLNRRLHSLYSG